MSLSILVSVAKLFSGTTFDSLKSIDSSDAPVGRVNIFGIVFFAPLDRNPIILLLIFVTTSPLSTGRVHFLIIDLLS